MSQNRQAHSKLIEALGIGKDKNVSPFVSKPLSNPLSVPKKSFLVLKKIILVSEESSLDYFEEFEYQFLKYYSSKVFIFSK